MGGGVLAEGRRQRAVRIAVIADIAVIARDRKSKILPRINTDDADQKASPLIRKIQRSEKVSPLINTDYKF